MLQVSPSGQGAIEIAHDSHALDSRWGKGFRLRQSIPGEKDCAITARNAGEPEVRIAATAAQGLERMLS